MPRHTALWPGTKEHHRGHNVWTRLLTATLGKSPITPPASSQACNPLLGLGVLFGAAAGLRFLSLHGLQPCSSSFCNYPPMKSSVIPHLQFVLHFSLGAGSSDQHVLTCVLIHDPFSATASIVSAPRRPHWLSVHTIPTEPLCNGVPWKRVLPALRL